MALYKRGNVYWADVIVNGLRYRESLKTSDGRKAPGLERELVTRIQNRAPDPTPKSKQLGSLCLEEAIDAYISIRAPQVSKRMVDYWREQSRPLIKAAAFRSLTLKKIRPIHIAEYQKERLAQGRAPKLSTARCPFCGSCSSTQSCDISSLTSTSRYRILDRPLEEL